MPIFPQVPPAPPSDPWLQMLSGLDQSEAARKAEIANLYGGLNSLFEGMLGDVNSRLAPEQQAIPAGTSPLGAMAATFAAALSDQLGRRDSATQNVQRTLAGQQEEQAAVKQQNTAMLNADMRDRQMQRVQLQMKIAETKMQQAKELGDVDEFYKHLKTQIQAEKYMQKLRQEGDMDLEKLRQSGRMKEITAKTPEAEAAAEKDNSVAEERELRMWQDSVEKIQKLPGSSKESGVRILGIGSRGTKLTEKGIKDLRNRAFTRVTTTRFPSVRTAALTDYALSFMEPDGTIKKETLESPAFRRFVELTNTVPPEEAQRVFDLVMGKANE